MIKLLFLILHLLMGVQCEIPWVTIIYNRGGRHCPRYEHPMCTLHEHFYGADIRNFLCKPLAIQYEKQPEHVAHILWAINQHPSNLYRETMVRLGVNMTRHDAKLCQLMNNAPAINNPERKTNYPYISHYDEECMVPFLLNKLDQGLTGPFKPEYFEMLSEAPKIIKFWQSVGLTSPKKFLEMLEKVKNESFFPPFSVDYSKLIDKEINWERVGSLTRKFLEGAELIAIEKGHSRVSIDDIQMSLTIMFPVSHFISVVKAYQLDVGDLNTKLCNQYKDVSKASVDIKRIWDDIGPYINQIAEKQGMFKFQDLEEYVWSAKYPKYKLKDGGFGINLSLLEIVENRETLCDVSWNPAIFVKGRLQKINKI